MCLRSNGGAQGAICMKSVALCLEAATKTKACAMVVHDRYIREDLITKADRLLDRPWSMNEASPLAPPLPADCCRPCDRIFRQSNAVAPASPALGEGNILRGRCKSWRSDGRDEPKKPDLREKHGAYRGADLCLERGPVVVGDDSEPARGRAFQYGRHGVSGSRGS